MTTAPERHRSVEPLPYAIPLEAHSSRQMGTRLRVQFGDPQHGWMVLTIQSGVRVATLNMSYVGFDTLDEMIDGLHALITGDSYRSVRIMQTRFSTEEFGARWHRSSRCLEWKSSAPRPDDYRGSGLVC